jgi:hypothetical protein
MFAPTGLLSTFITLMLGVLLGLGAAAGALVRRPQCSCFVHSSGHTCMQLLGVAALCLPALGALNAALHIAVSPYLRPSLSIASPIPSPALPSMQQISCSPATAGAATRHLLPAARAGLPPLPGPRCRTLPL